MWMVIRGPSDGRQPMVATRVCFGCLDEGALFRIGILWGAGQLLARFVCDGTVLDAGEVTLLGRGGHPCPQRVEINIGHASQGSPLIIEVLTLEAPFPEASGTFVFVVGASGDGFVEGAHEPTQVGESGP